MALNVYLVCLVLILTLAHGTLAGGLYAISVTTYGSATCQAPASGDPDVYAADVCLSLTDIDVYKNGNRLATAVQGVAFNCTVGGRKVHWNDTSNNIDDCLQGNSSVTATNFEEFTFRDTGGSGCVTAQCILATNSPTASPTVRPSQSPSAAPTKSDASDVARGLSGAVSIASLVTALVATLFA
jgi:hypothetical protein